MVVSKSMNEFTVKMRKAQKSDLKEIQYICEQCFPGDDAFDIAEPLIDIDHYYVAINGTTQMIVGFVIFGIYSIEQVDYKYIFKKSMEPYLPRDVIYRPKSGFGAPLRQWLHGELREVAMELLGEKSLKTRGLFDPKTVARLVDDDYSGKIDASYTIFSLMCIEWWMKMFVDGNHLKMNVDGRR